jgi:hypothetical protein
MTTIRGVQLTNFEVAANGETFSLHLMDEEAQPATLVLLTDCLNALIMTLPDVLRRSLLLRYRDDSMRVVSPVGSREVGGGRRSRPGHGDRDLRTPDGFTVSFALPALELLRMSMRSASTSAEATGIIGS